MRLVVVGADAAGMSAASQARRRKKPDQLRIVAFERGHFTSYSACGIPYWIGGAVPDRDALIARTPAEFAEAGIEVRLRHEVVGIDLDRGEVVARDLDGGGELREGFDELVYAAGAVPVTPDWARVDAGGVFGVQTLDDGAAIHRWLDSEECRKAVVIGGGYVGVEMAEAMVRRGLDVTLLEKSSQPMSTVDPDMGERVRAAICGLGIEVRTGTHVEGLETADGRIRAVVTPDGVFPADIVVLGLGVRPNTQLAVDSGIPVGVTGGLRTDLRMRVVGAPGVWAAGDCVQSVHRISGQPLHAPLGTHANKQGRVAGINIGGGYATFPGVIGTAVTKVCELEVARTGLTEKEAARAGFAFVTATVESTSRAGYYPGASPMVIKMIAERRTGILLGAQIVGREEAAKRIDSLAIAVWNRMTVEEMTALDLSYAPPFSPVWDPVLIAARKAADAVQASQQQ
ncbi:FAD-dependent oxidoreductase [Actinoplanes sp. N902-109]|uniref:FAD-dependent oxidoreductase n=1 Tax=Actinoplanes sp. (strain N902-109) TaxID=649831 RepID=UPI0003293A3D|nr:FAD-dependent oxidoreductase [Actinoplanes sp. N902-109]AGL20681.1 FAD-dependent pyridine nucleotide-disulfide oxidoreductase [Actinoplanes sp. N902-109]